MYWHDYPIELKIENGKIIEGSERALFKYYLKHDYDKIYSFPEFIERMKNAGVKIND